MSVNQGSITRDIFGQNLFIKGKEIITPQYNMKLPGNITCRDIYVRQSLVVAHNELVEGDFTAYGTGDFGVPGGNANN